MKKILTFISLIAVLLTGCSKHNDDSSIPPISKELSDTIISDFYEQSFVSKGVKDDSSFCNYYLPRLITKDSFTPYLYFGKYDNNTHILSFMINGFCLNATEMHDVKIEDNKLSFVNWIHDEAYENFYSPYLMPQVWQNGKVYTFVDAYNNKIITDEVLNKSTNYFGKEAITLVPTDVLPVFPITKEYFDRLPPLVGDNTVTKSLLIPSFEQIKGTFYKQEIEAKGIKDDAIFRESFTEEHYKHEVKTVDASSIHLDSFLKINDNFSLFFISINDLTMEVQSWFGDITGRSYTLGETYFCCLEAIEPIVVINNNLYYLTDAYNQNVLTEELVEELKNNISYPEINSNSKEDIETKSLERSIYTNPVISNN